MLSMIKSKAGPIGLDIGNNTIRMIQLSQRDNGIEVVACEEEVIAGSGGSEGNERHGVLVRAIRDMLERGSFEGKQVVSCLSNKELMIKSFRMSVSEVNEIDSLVMQEASARFGLDPDKDEIRFVMAGRILQGEEQKDEIILLAVKQAAIKEHISILEEAGLTPQSVDSIPFAILRSTQRSARRQADRKDTRFFVDVGGEFTTVMVGREDEINFVKQIPIAGRHLNEAVASKLEISLEEATMLRGKLQRKDSESVNASTRQVLIDAMRKVNEQLVQEISKCFRYHAVTFRGSSPKEIILAGGVAYEETLVNALRRHLG
ncbi:MAG: pilus assembly protein PilM, partial [Anaerohalosphaera sp.]|nr:pilus assembly protein PilM [Anaerohalosphaera sp.]